MAAMKRTASRSPVAGRGNDKRPRRPAAPLAAGVGLLCLAALVCPGCARRVPIGDLEGSGAKIWVRVVTGDGEKLTGQLVSLDASELVMELAYPVEGDVHLSTRLGETELFSGAERIEGELTDIIDGEDGRTALVQRRLRTLDIASATFHESKGEQSLRTILSMLVGPAVGGLAGLIF